MTPITLPAALRDVEGVQSVRTPIRLEYEFIPGRAAVAYLQAMKDKRILGQRDPSTGDVFVPPRGVNPVDGSALTEYVELPDRGHVGSFCVTNVPIPGRDDLSLPYVSAWIWLEGATVGFLGLVAGTDPAEVHLGLAVEAVWKPDHELEASAENILYWQPSGGPDRDAEDFR